MAELFDPYYKWLGIPPADQPPNHYRLLGVALHESDPEVIDAAAHRVMAYVQDCAQGPHLALSQQLLNEVAAARRCLLDPREKAAYDAQLPQRQQRPQRGSHGPTPPAAADPPDPLALRISAAPSPRRQPPATGSEQQDSPDQGAKSRRSKGHAWQQYALWLSPSLVLVLVAAWLLKPKPTQPPVVQYQRKIPAFDRTYEAAAANEPVSLQSLPGIALDDNQAELDSNWAPRQDFGAKYVGRFFQLAKSGNYVAKFMVPSRLARGTYEVRLSYVAAPDRATNVKVKIVTAGQTIDQVVNQRQAPAIDGLFHSLGTFAFQGQTPGGSAHEWIEITAAGADGVVIVDAVQFLPSSASAAKPATPQPAVKKGGKKSAK